VTHVHGAVGVADDSDGYAEAWYLPAAGNIPAGYATAGTWFQFFAAKAATNYGVTWEPGSAVFQYPNKNRASTIWYHDHTLGMTRLNVYAGPAGFYLIRGGPAGDDEVLDSSTGATALLPGPAPKENDKFPPNKTYYEIPIAIQDRSFNTDGSLFYPATRAFFDETTGPYRPDSDISPIWNPEFFGNMIMVNGNTWPFQTVEQRRYRFRFLNGCNSRFLILDFNLIPGVEVWQIGNEGGSSLLCLAHGYSDDPVGVLDLLDDIHSRNDLAENHVLAVQARRVAPAAVDRRVDAGRGCAEHSRRADARGGHRSTRCSRQQLDPPARDRVEPRRLGQCDSLEPPHHIWRPLRATTVRGEASGAVGRYPGLGLRRHRRQHRVGQ
jgi:hypothetical protein